MNAAREDAASDAQDERWPRFGPRENQVLHPVTADQLLTLWCEREPSRFGALLAEVLTGERPGGRRR